MALALVLMAMIVFIEGGSRFRAPLEPFVILLAAFALDAAWRRRRSWRVGRVRGRD